jgi:hypothetical protein
MQQRKIILFLIVLFILSSSFLLYTAKNFNNPDYNKNWWAVYFENPKTSDLNFVIENHSYQNTFHYVVLAGSDKIDEKDVSLMKGETKNIKPKNINPQENRRVTIQVISGEIKKEIYKN